MAKKLIAFSPKNAGRIARGVKRVEAMPPPPPGGRKSANSGETPGFWAELIEEGTGGNVGYYSWKRVDPKDDDWEDFPDADSGGEFTAKDINDTSGILPETRVWLRFVGYYDSTDTANSKPVYIFSIGGVAGLFPVNVSDDSGDGISTNFTYTVLDLAGNTIGSGMEPDWNRSGLQVAAAEHGTAYYGADGGLVLYQVDEVDLTGGCVTPE